MSNKPIQTRRNQTNAKKHEKHVNYATRMLNKMKFFKWKSRGE